MGYLSIDGYVNRYTYSGDNSPSRVERLLLSNSQNGKQISITGFNVSGFSSIHQTPNGTGYVDEIYLYASNHASSGIGDVDLTLSWGHDIPILPSGQVGADARNGEMKITIPYEAARFQVIDGKLLQNGLSVRGFETLTTGENDGYPINEPAVGGAGSTTDPVLNLSLTHDHDLADGSAWTRYMVLSWNVATPTPMQYGGDWYTVTVTKTGGVSAYFTEFVYYNVTNVSIPFAVRSPYNVHTVYYAATVTRNFGSPAGPANLTVYS